MSEHSGHRGFLGRVTTQQRAVLALASLAMLVTAVSAGVYANFTASASTLRTRSSSATITLALGTTGAVTNRMT